MFCLMRYLGLTLPRNWHSSRKLGRLLRAFVAAHLDKPFIDQRTLKPKIMNDIVPCQVRRHVNKVIMRDVRC